tara:strand:+ start:6091 stop:7872 length:1782 start_codon:yes stop_codon:yes gene_type:complete
MPCGTCGSGVTFSENYDGKCDCYCIEIGDHMRVSVDGMSREQREQLGDIIYAITRNHSDRMTHWGIPNLNCECSVGMSAEQFGAEGGSKCEGKKMKDSGYCDLQFDYSSSGLNAQCSDCGHEAISDYWDSHMISYTDPDEGQIVCAVKQGGSEDDLGYCSFDWGWGSGYAYAHCDVCGTEVQATFDNQFYEDEDFGAEKKNCGCGQDPCVTYGAEEFGAEEGRVRTISGRELMKRIRRTPQQIEEEMRNNPPCEECGSATTEEVRSGVEGTYEYVCYDDECEWTSFPPHTDYGAGRVRTMSGKPHTPRKLVKDKDITPEEASQRLNLEAEGKTYYQEGREAAKAVFMPDLDERDSYGQLDTEYMVYFNLTPEEMVRDIEMQNPRYNQFAWGWSQGWDDATFEHLLNPDDNSTVMEDWDYSADTETFNGYYVGSGWQEEYIPDGKDIFNTFVIGGAAILAFLGVDYMKKRMGAETFNAPASCTDEDSCDDGFTCVDGECIKTCKDDGDCASWQECRDDLHPTENVCGEDKTYSTSNPFTQKQQTSSNVDDSPSSSIKPVGMTMTRKVVIGGSVIGVAAIGLAAMQNRNKNGGEE